MRLIMIRHGQTDANLAHQLDTGFPGTPLNATGQAQAAGLVERLKDEPIEAIMASDIVRARQTAEPLAAATGVPLISHPGVREIFAGDLEMRTDWTDYISVIQAWSTDPTVRMPGAQNGLEFARRFDRAVAEMADHDCAAIVSHGAALRTWLIGATGLAVDDGPQWVLANTAVVVIEGQPGAWQVVSWADRQLA